MLTRFKILNKPGLLKHSKLLRSFSTGNFGNNAKSLNNNKYSLSLSIRGGNSSGKEIYTDQSQERKYGEPPLEDGQTRQSFTWEKYAWLYVIILGAGTVALFHKPDRDMRRWAYEEAHHTPEREIKGRVLTELYREQYPPPTTSSSNN